MSDINLALFSGRIAQQPELRQTPSGLSVCDLRVANNQRIPSTSPEDQPPAQRSIFMKVTTWGKRAEWAHANLQVGDAVLIGGQLVDDNYTPEGADKPTSARVKIDYVDTLRKL